MKRSRARPFLEALEDRNLLSAVSWTGGGGDFNWDNGLNWSTGTTPGAGDDVQISSGPVNLAHAATVNSLSLSNATLVDSAVLTVSGSFFFGGTLTGGGSVTAAGGGDVGGPHPTLDGFTLNIAAGQTLTFHANLTAVHGAAINNAGTFVAISDTITGDASAVFTNAGSFVEAAGATTPVVGVVFNNSGTVTVKQGGSLQLDGPISNAGALTGAAGSSLSLNGPFTDLPTASIQDAGSVRFGSSAVVSGTYSAGATAVGGPVAFSGTVEQLGAVSLSGTVDLTQASFAPGGATLASLSFLADNAKLLDSAALTVSGSFTFVGILTGGGSLTAAGGGDVGGPHPTLDDFTLKVAAGQTLTFHANLSAVHGAAIDNAGTAVWISDTVSFYDDASFTNTATGTFDDQIDGSFGSGDGNCQVFNNEGLFLKSGGTGTTYLQMQLNNSGTVRIDHGILNLGCGYVQGSGGSISGSVSGDVSNPGQYNSGPSPTPPVLTSYTQTVAGTLSEQIGGLTAGTEYGQIIVNGDVNLAGSLQVALINNPSTHAPFIPHANDQFTIIDNRGSNPIHGTFNNLAEGAIVWDVTHTYRFAISYLGVNGHDNDVVLTSQQTATTTTVTASANPSVLNQAVTFTATVTPAAGSGTPTGTVQFQIDNNPVGGGITLSGGMASFSTATLSVGTHSIAAIYSGDGSFLGGSGSLTQTVYSAQQQIDSTITQVNALVPGVLNSGNGNALIVKLNSATNSLNAGHTTAGINQLNAFINQVTYFQMTGKLTDDQERALRNAATLAINALGGAGAHLLNDTAANTSSTGNAQPVTNAGQLVTGTIGVYLDNADGTAVTADEQARFDDAINALNTTFGCDTRSLM